MFKKVFVICLFFNLSAFAYDYRHVDIARAKTGSYYLGVGLGMPLTNKTTDLSTFNIQIDPATNIAAVINQYNINYQTGSATFDSSRIAGNAFIGYKFPYFFRTDFKIDFTTFSKDYQVVPDGTNQSQTLKFTVRQFALIANGYLDLDNRTPFTPYIGAGGGVAFTSAVFTLGSVTPGSSSEEEPDGSIFDKAHFVYELKGGVLIGSRRMFLDLEYIVRNTPALKLTSSGFSVKVAFRI